MSPYEILYNYECYNVLIEKSIKENISPECRIKDVDSCMLRIFDDKKLLKTIISTKESVLYVEVSWKKESIPKTSELEILWCDKKRVHEREHKLDFRLTGPFKIQSTGTKEVYSVSDCHNRV